VKTFLFGSLLTLMALAAASPLLPQSGQSVEELAAEPRVARALKWLEKNLAWVDEQHLRITEIPAPTFQETQRGAFVRKLFEQAGLRTRVDSVGNVIGERLGVDTKNVILLAAHLDTVFPVGTDVRVRRDAEWWLAPGVTDNSSGVAALVAVARALHEARVRTAMTIVFAANVAEEGEGNLRGMRKLVETYGGRLKGVIAIDGSAAEHVTTRALASRRIEVVVTGPGGHSWSDFGLPNPIHALSRGVARFVRVRVPEEPRTTFNVGRIEGGTSVNSIPARASIKVDLRSVADAEIGRLEKALREAVRAGIDDELAAARVRGTKLEAKFSVIGVRPSGEIAPDAALLAAIRDVDRFLGNRAHTEVSSTDANVPLSLGIPAIAIGGGGRGGSGHSLNEWYSPVGREAGLKRILLTLVAASGVER
jgi:acetylornithine deacetylase/succinyl-diaminopimelate desuccinylase-like protein